MVGKMRRNRCGGLGFSLLELMIVVAILLILGAVATPSLLRSMRRYQTEATARDVANMLMRARYEAVQNNRRVATIFRAPTGGKGAQYGIDRDLDGTLDPDEPRVMAPSQVTFWRNNAPAWPPTTSLPPDYASTSQLALPPAYSVSFAADGTVVTQQGGSWQLAPRVQVICFIRGQTSDRRNFEAWLIAVTPTGGVRVWRWDWRAGWMT